MALSSTDILRAFNTEAAVLSHHLKEDERLASLGSLCARVRNEITRRVRFELADPAAILSFYAEIQNSPDFSAPSDLIHETRTLHRAFIERLIRMHHTRRCVTEGFYRRLTPRREIDRERRIAEAAVQIQAAAADHRDLSKLDQEWMRNIGLPWDLSVEKQDWELLSSFLPNETRKRFFLPEEMEDREEMIKRIIEEHWDLMKVWGGAEFVEERLRQLLIAAGMTDAPQRAAKIIGKYLGQVKIREFDIEDAVNHVPPALLERTEARELLHDTMMKYVYRELVADGFDTLSLEDRSACIRDLGVYAKAIIDQKQQQHPELDFGRHQEIIRSVIAEYVRISEMLLPAGIRNVIKTKGEEYPFPSLAQLLFLREMEKRDTGMICVIPYGKGKTELMYLTAKHLGCEKLIIVGPPSMRHEYPGRFRREHAEEGREPMTSEESEPIVGTVEPGISAEQLERVVRTSDILIVPYTMMGQVREGDVLPEDDEVENGEGSAREGDQGENGNDENGPTKEEHMIVERLKKLVTESKCFIAYDEAQSARSATKSQKKRSFTNNARELSLVTHKNGGRAALFSATPFQNKVVQELIAYLSIADPLEYGDVSTLRAAMKKDAGPRRFKNACHQYIFCPDPPEDIRSLMTFVEYHLETDGARIYQTILDEDDMELSTKQVWLHIAAFHSSLASQIIDEERGRVTEVANTSLDRLTSIVAAELQNEQSAFIVLNRYKRGFTCPHDVVDPSGRFTFSTLFEQRLRPLVEANGTNLHCYIIDGEVGDDERERAIAQMRSSEAGNGSKTVVMLLQQCRMLEGRDFSDCHVIVYVGPTDNPTDMYQGIKRLLREKNNRVRSYVLMPKGTILESVYERGLEKDELAGLFLHGLRLNDATLQRMSDLSKEDIKDLIDADAVPGLRKEYRPPRHMSDNQKMQRMADRYHGEGSKSYGEFANSDDGKLYADTFVANYYQGQNIDNARFVAGLYEDLEKGGIIKGNKCLDAGGGPGGLFLGLGSIRSGNGNGHAIREYTNIDINPYMIEHGQNMVSAMHSDLKNIEHVVGSFTDLEHHFPGRKFSAINCAYAAYYTSHNPDRKVRKAEDERVKTFIGFNRALDPDGVLVLTMPLNRCSDSEFECLKQAAPFFCFEVLENYTGIGEATDTGSRPFQNRTLALRKNGEFDEEAEKRLESDFDIRLLSMTKQRTERTVEIKVGPRTSYRGEDPEVYRSHRRFRIGEKTEFSHSDDDQRDENLAHYRFILAATRYLINYYDIRRTFRDIGRDAYSLRILSGWGVQPLTFGYIEGGRTPFRYSMGGYTEIFDPLDPKWRAESDA